MKIQKEILRPGTVGLRMTKEKRKWIPAFAGMTNKELRLPRLPDRPVGRFADEKEKKDEKGMTGGVKELV